MRGLLMAFLAFDFSGPRVASRAGRVDARLQFTKAKSTTKTTAKTV